jgi:hypothetical protein
VRIIPRLTANCKAIAPTAYTVTWSASYLAISHIRWRSCDEERAADLQPGCARFVLPRVFQVTKFHVNRYKQCAMPHACASLYDLSFGCPF